MKERPILFSAPMVRAILAGTKTQTRRVVKPRRDLHIGCELAPCELAGEVNAGDYFNAAFQPGDHLWVRETHTFCPRSSRLKIWLHTPEEARVVYGADDVWLSGPYGPHKPKMRPSIHMPRWASRITLEVTGVRVERLKNISETDAIAEGAPWAACGAPQEGSHQVGFAHLWESINGPGSWDTNPWVWVIEFRRVAS